MNDILLKIKYQTLQKEHKRYIEKTEKFKKETYKLLKQYGMSEKEILKHYENCRCELIW